MAIPKKKPVISQGIADDINNISSLRGLINYWDDLDLFDDKTQEIQNLYERHGFDSCTELLAYLWSTKDFDVKESYRVYVRSWVNSVYTIVYIKKESPRELTSTKSKAKVFTKADAIKKVKQLEFAGLDAYKEEIKGE